MKPSEIQEIVRNLLQFERDLCCKELRATGHIWGETAAAYLEASPRHKIRSDGAEQPAKHEDEPHE